MWVIWDGVVKGSPQHYIVPVHLALRFAGNKIVEEFGYYNRSAINEAIKAMNAANSTAQ